MIAELRVRELRFAVTEDLVWYGFAMNAAAIRQVGAECSAVRVLLESYP